MLEVWRRSRIWAGRARLLVLSELSQELEYIVGASASNPAEDLLCFLLWASLYIRHELTHLCPFGFKYLIAAA